MPSWKSAGAARGLALAAALAACAAGPVPVEELLSRVKAVRREGTGNAQAAAAWRALAQLGPDTLPAILAAMDDDNALTSNWLRTAVDAVAERALAAGRPLPTAALERFIAQTRHPAIGRRLAYEWLSRVDPATPGRLLPGMIHDPSPELRRDAVAAKMKEAQQLLAKGDKDAARAVFEKAFAGACDQDQADAIAKELKSLGITVDLAAHFGVVRTWHLAAQFDNTNGAGFKTIYAPEKGVDLAAIHKGKGGADVRWVAHTTDDIYGRVDLNAALGKHKAAVAYACATIESPTEQLVRVRAGSITALKVFVNGVEVFGKEEYHHGMRLDQYTCTAKLKPGRNELLLKICQNNQTESWAQDWKFQVRLTDATGAAVPFTPARTEAKVKP
jgi:hypothetical protein